MRLLAQDLEEVLAVEVPVDEELLYLVDYLLENMQVLRAAILSVKYVLDRAHRNEELLRANHGQKAEHEAQAEKVVGAEGPDLRRLWHRHLISSQISLEILSRLRIISLLQDVLDLLEGILQLLRRCDLIINKELHADIFALIEPGVDFRREICGLQLFFVLQQFLFEKVQLHRQHVLLDPEREELLLVDRERRDSLHDRVHLFTFN